MNEYAFDMALTYIKDKYPNIEYSIVADSDTFAPILGFIYEGIVVSKKLSTIAIIAKDFQYWIVIKQYLLGFDNLGESSPDYKYIIDGRRTHKSNFRKTKLEFGLSENYIELQKKLLSIKNAKIIPIDTTLNRLDSDDGIHLNARGHIKFSKWILKQ